ncbi:MAG: deoxyribodipyrimidine photo-lyase [Hyphomicrobiales bacterium]
MSSAPVILWLRCDLRLHDHPALTAAAAMNGPVIPLYILDDGLAGRWAMGGASRWWLHNSLRELDLALQAKGSRLVLRRGATMETLETVARATGARALYWSRGYEPWSSKLEAAIHRRLEGAGVRCRRFSGQLLFEPEDIRTGNGDPYKVYTPFSRACFDAPDPGTPLPAPSALRPVPDDVISDDLADWGLLPENPDWASGIAEAWIPGEAAARMRFNEFVEKGLSKYKERRDRPDLPGTSRMSPSLHFGEVSPRHCWHMARARAGGRSKSAEGAMTFLRELLWREFSWHLLFHWPHLPETPFRPEFSAFPWNENATDLEAWRKGRTGYPIVDAGMRELWTTGWMHNRVRMIVASFLVKHLLIPWQQGEAWFWDTLVDADLANNAASWQWVAGSGADAAPYFRIFNPILQGKKFDPKGDYIRKWVPELAKLPSGALHAPFEAAPATLRKAKVALGETYPGPIVGHDLARRRALEAYEVVKKRG